MNHSGILISSPTKPRLWVETLWLLDSLTATRPLREVSLQRGLNLIVSPPGAGSSGHGVGKTAFCQLLRFVLDDPLWSAGSNLRDELLRSRELKEGAVAARVHVGGEAWTVLKPWLHQKHYRASRSANWQQLAANTAENEFSEYQAALRRHLVEILPTQELPMSGQTIEWYQILAWCSRDQNARYQSYYQWRADGAGFSLPAKSPAALMQIVLGLLHDPTTLRELDEKAKEIEEKKTKLQELRQEAAHLLKHARRQLNQCLNTSADIPFRRKSLLESPNLIGLARQRHDAYQQELLRIHDEQKKLAEQRQLELEKRVPLKARIDLLDNEIQQIKALVAGNKEAVERLQKEAPSLQQRLSSLCDAGNRLLRDCQYVMQRIQLLQIDRVQRIAQNQSSQKALEAELAPLCRRLDELKSEESPIRTQLANINQRDGDLQARQAQALAADQTLDNAIQNYEVYEAIATGRQPSPEMAAVQTQLASLQRCIEQLQVKHEAEREAAKGRRRVISESMQAVAKSLPSFQWGVFNDEDKHRHHPFQMGPMHSTTFKVLEILAGDIACLLDSASAQSFHPGFLLHDSPREAEMSEAILWALLNCVSSNRNGAVQYIVTTSTELPETFKPYERLRLSADSEDGLFFRRRLDAAQASLL